MTSTTTTNNATDRQVAYICDLMDRKNLFASPSWFDATNAMDREEYAAHIARVKAGLPNLSRSAASRYIEKLQALPTADQEEVKSSTTHHTVAAGRYAIEHGGTLKFYRVDCPTEGRWAGYTFVKVQASEDYYPVKGGTKAEVLKLIARDPQTAMQRYGQELGSCGNCGRTLTDEYSREVGIGPVCRGRLGM